jgi:hypothetical protein
MIDDLEPCGCTDFEAHPEDPDECWTCEHIKEEHESSGFFRKCLVGGGVPAMEHDLPFTVEEVEKAIERPMADWARDCHSVSLAIVKSGLVEGRVARGVCSGVGAQHSWVVVGDDCYDHDAQIIDPTLWSYRDDVEGIWTGSIGHGWHAPHGAGSIWAWGRPTPFGGEPISLTPSTPLSKDASAFLALIGPLDRDGWAYFVSNAPVEGWPAAEIISAVADTKRLAHFIPIDRLGMLTDRNPGGLYLPGDERETADA